MATLKMIERTATVAFAPMGSMMAAGTMAGAIDPSFSSSPSLEILQLDFANTEKELPVIKSCPTPEGFNRLSWGNAVGSEDYSLGIIAGGLADGSINLWNPAKLLRTDSVDPVDPVIARAERHSGGVRGLEFSLLSPNLLASGGGEGDLYIWDLKVPTQPTHYPPLRGGDGSAQGEISYLSWNRKVQPILATTSYSGTSVVWDLRGPKRVLSFTDPNSRRRCSTLQWNPDNATQLVVASDDDRSPSLQVWDLRNSVSPLKEFVGHSKGVLAMAWCPIDSSLLLTCGKDNLTLCWNTSTGEVLYELPSTKNWNFDVQWSPRIPGVLSTSSLDGNISIYNIEACSQMTSNETSFGREIKGMDSSMVKRAPKWLKRPVGVSFGFGGKFIKFGPNKGAPGVAGLTISEIHLHSLVTEDELVKQSCDFESEIKGGEKPVLRDFCDSKAQKAGNKDDKETWSFLKVMFEDDARHKLLTHLNFEVVPTEPTVRESEENANSGEGGPPHSVEAESPEGNKPQRSTLDSNALQLDDAGEQAFFDNFQTPETPEGAIQSLEGGSPHSVEEEISEGNEPQLSTLDSNAGEQAFFDNFQIPKTPDRAIQSLEDLTLDANTNDGDVSTEKGLEGEVTEESEEAVQRALVVGDFKAAVQHCLAANRVADALILAYVGGSTLWETTQNDYIAKTGRSYLKILSAVAANDLRSLVEKRPLKAWKETLALLCTYARSEDWTLLSDALAARLDSANKTQAATLCYICSGNIEKSAEIWSRSLEYVSGGRNYGAALQALMEKVVVLSLATGQKRLSTSLARFVKQYAELLVSQGLLATAQEYLSLVPADKSSLELSILQDRIYGSGSSDVQSEPPSVPWESQPLEDAHPSLTDPAQGIYPPTENRSSYYQPALVPSPRSFRDDVDPPQRTYPPTETTPSYPPGLASGGYNSSVYPPQPQPLPTSYNINTTSHGGYYPSAPDPWYPPRSNGGLSFSPGVSSQPFIPGVPSQTFTPGVPAQTFTPSVPVQTFKPSVSVQTFTPQQPAPALPRQAFMPVSPRQQSLSFSGPGAAAKVQTPQLSGTFAPVAPPAQAPTIQTVDTSSVSAELKPVVATLTRLHSETSEAFGGSRANPAKRREIDSNSRKLGALLLKLTSGDLSANASSKLLQLCQALDIGDYATALQIQVDLTTSDWDECSVWLTALKQMIKARQTLRSSLWREHSCDLAGAGGFLSPSPS